MQHIFVKQKKDKNCIHLSAFFKRILILCSCDLQYVTEDKIWILKYDVIFTLCFWEPFECRSGIRIWHLNSSPPSATYMHQWTGSTLVQVIACCFFSAKPLLKLVLAYCQMDCWEQISVKFEFEFCHFHSRKCIWNCHLPIWWPFCPGGDELIWSSLCLFKWVSQWTKILLKVMLCLLLCLSQLCYGLIII